jgi:PST family polysaccharide transporter
MPGTEKLGVDLQADSLKRRTVRGGTATFVAQAANFLLRLAAQIAIARLLVPADFGLIAMIAPILALVQLVADFGLGQAVVQSADIKQEEISALFWLGLAINIAIAGLVGLISPLIAWIYHEPRLVSLCIAFAALIPISGLSTQPAALLSRNLRFTVLALLDVAPPALGLVAGFAAAWFGLGYWSLVVSTASERLAGVLFIWSISTWRPTFHFFNRTTWSLVRIGGRITGVNLVQYVTTTADNILLALTQGASALGLYDKGYKIVTQPIGQLLAPTNRIAVPLLVRLRSEADRYRRAYLRMLQVTLLIGTPGIVFVLVMSKPLMLILLGPRWNGIAPVISWLCLGCLASPFYSSCFWLFLSQGRTGQLLTYATMTSIISVAGFVCGLPWGPTGVAAGAGLSFLLLSTPLTCWGATRVGPVSSKDLVTSVLPLIVALLSTTVALASLSTFAPFDGDILLVPAMAVAYGVFFMVMLALPRGRNILQGAWQLRAMLKAEKDPKSPAWKVG